MEFAETGLKITIVCYFATKSFDEFLYLQQVALLEVARVVSEAGATMTSVLHVDMNDPSPIPKTTMGDMAITTSSSGHVVTQELDALATSEHQDQAIRGISGGSDGSNQTASEVAQTRGGLV